MNKEIILLGGKAYKKCKVIMLPTKEQNIKGKHLTKCHLVGEQLRIGEMNNDFHNADWAKQQHLYITSNEEIKEGNWYYDKIRNSIHQMTIGILNVIKSQDNYSKIIATTDSSLKFRRVGTAESLDEYDSLPRPSDAFIQKYIEKQGKIDEVLVEYENKLLEPHKDEYGDERYNKFDYKLKVALDNTITIKPVKDSWNREEVVKAYNLGFKNGSNQQFLNIDE